MNDINTLYDLWLERAVSDEDLTEELKGIEGNEEEILDRFYKNLEFGTAGLRGVIGAGTNRMNVYTVAHATQGLSDFLNANYKNASVAIAYDSRIKSDVFAQCAAGVLAANGIKVYFFPELVPTPMLSFAIRRLKCKSGIIITASHNPAKYNGYKCYGPEGYQMTDEAAAETYGYIQKVDMFDGVKIMDFEEALAVDMVDYIENWLVEEFYEKVQSCCVNPEICRETDLKVIYSPLNGTGNKPVREILRRIGINDVTVVPEQEYPNGNFDTCPYPNPEIQQTFEYAIKMTDEIKADLLLATDPDCDRVGIAVLDNGEYKLMTGNEVGVLMAEYLFSQRKENGTLPKDPIVVKTIVTTELVAAVAKKYGGEAVDLLTGFKYIGELVTSLEKKKQEKRFIVGMEESYGYLTGTHARDKDGVVASMIVCEMAAYYKSQGKNLVDVINDIYAEHGMYLNTLLNFEFEGAEGMEKMAQIMENLRKKAPKKINEMKVEYVLDYQKSISKNTTTKEETEILLPKSNVLSYKLPGGNGVVVRPSGTEPKIKVYITSCERTKTLAEKQSKAMIADIKKIMNVK